MSLATTKAKVLNGRVAALQSLAEQAKGSPTVRGAAEAHELVAVWALNMIGDLQKNNDGLTAEQLERMNRIVKNIYLANSATSAERFLEAGDVLGALRNGFGALRYVYTGLITNTDRETVGNIEALRAVVARVQQSSKSMLDATGVRKRGDDGKPA